MQKKLKPRQRIHDIIKKVFFLLKAKLFPVGHETNIYLCNMIHHFVIKRKCLSAKLAVKKTKHTSAT